MEVVCGGGPVPTISQSRERYLPGVMEAERPVLGRMVGADCVGGAVLGVRAGVEEEEVILMGL